MTGHTSWVSGVAFGPGGLLASASDDQTIRLWDTPALTRLRDHAVQVACERAGRGLSKDEWARYLPDERYRDTCNPVHRSS